MFTGAARLASERFDDRAFLNVAVIAGWLVLASIHVLSVLRARRAIEANRPDVG